MAEPYTKLTDVTLKRFCHEYLFECGQNATQAYLKIRPHVTLGTARTESAKLLAEPGVQQLIVDMGREALQRNNFQQDYVIRGWLDMSRANVMDYFEVDAAADNLLKLKDLSALPVEVQRNVTAIETTTDRRIEPREGQEPIEVVTQKVKLRIVDRKGVYADMAKALELFGALERRLEESNSIMAAITEGFERVARAQGARTIDVSQAQEGELA